MLRYVCGECGEKFERGGYCARDGKPIIESEDALVGSEIGRYRVARLLAEGGMGRVYLGVQPTIGSRVAIKVLSESSTQSDLIDRFFGEARSVNMIRHENIVSVIDMAKLDDGRPYIVMEFIEGATLAALVKSAAAPLGGVVQVMLEVLSALQAAHAIGIVHRDLKPDNIIVTGEGHAKVLDFGIAKLLPGISQQLSPRTRTGALLGTPAYMAPEQISGSGQIDPRTDIYAAGIVLYEAVTGRVPFVGETLFDLMRMHLEVAPQPPSALRSDLPLPLEQVILQALAKDPAQRFQTASAMAQALQHASTELKPDDWRALSSRGAIITGGGAGTAHISRPPKKTAAAPTPHREPLPEETRIAPENRRSIMPWVVGTGVVAAIAVLVTVLALRRDDKPATIAEIGSGSGSSSAVETDDIDAPDAPVAVNEPAGSGAPTTPGTPTTPPTKSQPKPVDLSGVTIVPSKPQQHVSMPFEGNAKNFNPVAFLPKALALAQRLAPDAKLSEFEFSPVYSDGHVDLTQLDDDSSSDYRFRSVAGSKRPDGIPPNKPVELPCMIYVELTPTKVTARIVETEHCLENKLVRNPTCSLAWVWQQAIAETKVPKDHIAKIGWLDDQKWFFTTDVGNNGTGETTSFADQCP